MPFCPVSMSGLKRAASHSVVTSILVYEDLSVSPHKYNPSKIIPSWAIMINCHERNMYREVDNSIVNYSADKIRVLCLLKKFRDSILISWNNRRNTIYKQKTSPGKFQVQIENSLISFYVFEQTSQMTNRTSRQYTKGWFSNVSTMPLTLKIVSGHHSWGNREHITTFRILNSISEDACSEKYICMYIFAL